MSSDALRIVHVVRSDGFAGVERYIVDTASELAARGHRVEVIGGAAERMRAELPATVRHHRGHTGADVAQALWRIGRCDIVHAHMTAAESCVALLRARNGGAFITTRHFAGCRGASRTGRAIAPLIRARIDAQISISKYVAESIGEASTVVLNGVRSSAFDHVRPRSRTVVVLQRFESEKETGLALRAWLASGLGGDGWRLALYGRGREEADLRRASHALGIDDSVDFGGFTQRPRELLADAAILLATAPTEPFGLTVVEGMAEGIAVVAADGGAHRETLGSYGAYFAPHDVEQCAERLRELARSAQDRLAAGAALRDRHAELFAIPTHVDALLAIYAGAR